MIRRKITPLLRQRLKEYPAAALVGPRQVGKTTLAKALGGHYFDLELESARLELDLRWDELMRGRERLILDEAQEWPELFNRLRGAIDADRRRMGRFLLLGSVSPALTARVSQSLAGRLALVELTPFLCNEIGAAALSRHWLVGGFPDGGIIHPKGYPQWQGNYLSLLTQRDLPAWGLPAKPATTLRLLKMLAALNGQQWNASQVGQSLGLSYHSINSYLEFLNGTFVTRVLQPFHANLSKRLVKSPKIYVRDSGLLHALLNIGNADALLNHPSVGASWEGYVIEQILGVLRQSGAQFDAFYLRTSDQYEIDLLLDFGGKLNAIEIKLSSSPSQEHMTRLNKAADLVGAKNRILLSRVTRPAIAVNRISCDLPWLLKHLDQLA